MVHSQHHALRRLMWSDAALVLLGERPYQWYDGGCQIAAVALYDWVRASGHRAYLDVVEDALHPTVPQHVVAYVPGRTRYYLDAYGIRRKRALLASMQRERLREPWLRPMTLGCTSRIPFDREVSDALAALLMAELGPYQRR